jgi:hypothetical protein
MRLESRYPILMAAMNQVSDLNLALAGHAAGIFPSLSFFNYWKKVDFDLTSVEQDLLTFKKRTLTTNLIISLGATQLLNDKILELLIETNFLKIEVVDGLNMSTIPQIQKIRIDLKNKGFLLFVKQIVPKLIMETDVVILKGNEGAGTFSEKGHSHSLQESFNYMKKAFPSLHVIPSGGIKNSQDVSYYLNRDATAVGIGSLFAFSKESKISDKTKNKVIESTSDEITRIKDKNQKGLMFDEIRHDDLNNTLSLRMGIQDPTKGHVFVGNSIDVINSIKTVKEIVEDLVTDIKDL